MSVVEEMSMLLPDTAAANDQGHLVVGGCDVAALADEFGTPLYIFDEATLRRTCTDYRNEFSRCCGDTLVIYAAKVFLCRALAIVIKEEGLGIDVVSGGELAIARSVDFPAEKVYFHGNNKLREEIELAISWGVGRIVVDNIDELSQVNEVAREAGITQRIMLRLTPGIDAHTHQHITTGVIDSKFGLSITSGHAEEAAAKSLSASNLDLIGLHVHLGSLIFSVEPYQQAVKIIFEFAAQIGDRYGFDFREFSPGGGFAVTYTRDTPAPDVTYYASAIADSMQSSCRQLGIQQPRLVIEPGRAIVGRSAMAVYRAGAIKDIPGVRKYVAVDGGMADNIRPALYGSRYEALVANKVREAVAGQVTIAGKFCESGDILVKDVQLPNIAAGDLIALPVCGAYCLPLASNYNASLRPAVVLVNDGKARVIRRRETYDDLMNCDLV
jgi:diaminopimelate decarboxylase